MKPYHAPALFMRDLFQQPLWVIVWVNILMAVNLAGIFFWQEPLAQVVFYTFMVTAVWMMVLYYTFGFERILGLGHVLWLALVPYLLFALPDLQGPIYYYVLTTIVINSVSLVFDINDVRLYLSENKMDKGEK